MAVIIPVATKYDDSGIKKAKSAFSGLSSTLKSTVGALGIGLGMSALVNTLKDASKAAVEDVKSQALLANQLRNTVGASDQAVAGAEKFISALQLQTSVADDQLRPALASLVRATGDVGQAQQLLSLSTDIAAGTGKDLSAVALAVGKAATGQTTALYRLIPSLKGSSDWAAEAAKQFDGAAQSAANNDPYQRLTVIFGEVQEQIGMALLPELNNLADYFASPAGQKELQGYASLIKELAGVFIFLGTTVAEFLAGFKVVGTAFGKLLTGDFKGFIDLMNSRGMVDALARLDGMSTKASKTSKAKITLPSLVTGGSSKTGSATKKTNPVADYYKKLADDVAKQKAKVKLTSKGLSTAFAESIIGSGADWQKLYKKISKTNAKGLAALQAQFRNTEAGYQEALAIAQAAFDAEMEAWQGRKDAYDAQVEAINNFKQSMKGILASVKPLDLVTREIGQFEQDAIDAFNNISKALEDGLANGTLTKAAYDNLRNYANAETSLLAQLGQRRDALAKKRGLAEALISDVKGSILGLGDLAGLVSNETRKITTTVTKLVGGVTVATRSTIEETVGASGYLDRLKDIVAKTKNFANQLTELKALGLNKNLFAQIVQAGPTVGGELATEILKGGSESVVALNDTFTQLETVAADVAEQTAVVMYGAGVDVTNGLVNGLLAEEQKLVNAAQTLADAFTSTFNARMNALVLPTLPNPGSAPVFIAPPVFVPAPVAPKVSAAPKAKTTVNVNVKASPVNAKATGKAVVTAVNKYYTSSGGGKFTL